MKNLYFWRTHQQQEIDLIEEEGGKMKAYEFKYSREKYKIPKAFMDNYPDVDVYLINRDNYRDFLL